MAGKQTHRYNRTLEFASGQNQGVMRLFLFERRVAGHFVGT